MTETTSAHTHAEAFNLMRYTADGDSTNTELIWNSRDGVTPFVVTLKDGSAATHRDWRSDQYRPDHTPSVGDRIFVDMTEDRCRELAETNAVRFWNDPRLPASSDDRWATVEQLAEDLERSYLMDSRRGAPDLVEVTEEMAHERGWL